MERLRLRVVDERRGRFAALRDSTVLIYWPHGLGDWVHLSVILPMLEPSNRYFITRFGDDFVSVLDGNSYLRTIHSGVNEISDGSEAGARHFGLDFKRIRGTRMDLAVPERFAPAFSTAKIDAVLYTDYPETQGESRFPFHTKARKLLHQLVLPERLACFDLGNPLPSTIDFHVPPEIQALVNARLLGLMEPGERLCVVASGGHTAARKNWNVAQARRFEELLSGRDKRWHFLSPDSNYGALFSGLGLPFALTYKAILVRTDLVVGVPAGPLHMAMAHGGVPSVGIWIAHHPDWYDEPAPHARHLVGSGVVSGRPATLTKPPAWRHAVRTVDSVQIPAEDVLETVAALL